MFLKHRALQAEYFDALDRPAEEIAESYAMLARVNRFFSHAAPFQRFLPTLLNEARCHSLTVLDLGAGDGSLGDQLTRWATARGWDWRFTNLDLNPQVVRLNPKARWVIGSALQLPFQDQAFDIVIASQMTHHFMSDEEVCRHFQEAWRVTRHALFFNDLHRNAALYSLLWVWLRIFRLPKHFRSDCLLSVRRGWRTAEWRKLAGQAGIPNARIRLHHGTRLLLQACREPNERASEAVVAADVRRL